MNAIPGVSLFLRYLPEIFPLISEAAQKFPPLSPE